MKSYILLIALLVCSFIIFPAWTAPDEGMWLMDQLRSLPWQEMKQHGMQLAPEDLYNPNGASLTDAIVLLAGGTASFVSDEGLIITNHHVAFSAIQSVSSVSDDYLKNGFHAKTREEELSIPSYSASIVKLVKDVTTDVLAVVNDTMTTEARAKAIRAKITEMQAAEKTKTGYDCTISETYNGVKYYQYDFETLTDVRLVYAPPSSIGVYGGEVDNWMWPRHTGDFGFMRAYVAPNGKPAKYAKDNVPYKPKKFLPVSTQGVREGDFAMIMGFPGRTFRYRTSPEIQLAKDESLPLQMDLFKKRMDIIEAAGKKDRAVEIKYASVWRGIANTYKNYQGTLEGMKRSNVMDLRKKDEEKFQAFVKSTPELEKKYGTILTDISKAYADLKTFNKKQIILGALVSSASVLRIASRVNSIADSFKEDSTGHNRPDEKMVGDLNNSLASTYKNLELLVDKQILESVILAAADLPKDQQIEAIQKVVGSKSGSEREKEVREFVDDLYRETKLTTAEGCTKLLSESQDDIRDDEFVEFASSIDKELQPLQAKATKFNAQIGFLRSKLIEARVAWKGDGLYPDANRTLRLTYGVVKPYSPRDAVRYDYVTTLGGIMEKETGEDPFVVPTKLKDLWEKKDFGRYADPKLNDVPVAFIANLDITGGNSGSPVINGKGDLIGVAFDGNWEAVVGDYVFQEPLNRAISVDSRYVLFVLDKFSNAQNLMQEMVIH